MNKKLSNKDLKDWENFVKSNEKIQNKDNSREEIKYKKEATIDLHGFTLEQANRRVEKFITDCFKQKVLKLNIITGKGLRSKVDQNPYQSKDLGILKYSVPEFIKSSPDLNKHVLSVNEADVKDGGEGAILIKLKNL